MVNTMDYIKIILRMSFFYFFILIIYRIMGKREVGQLGIIDLIVSILIAELVALGIENKTNNILNFLLPIFLLASLEILQTFIELKFNHLKTLFDGKPSVLIKKGKLNIKEMIKTRFSIDDLSQALRNEGIKSINEVNYCILESNGKISLFKKNKILNDETYPLPLIIDGRVDKETLKTICKSENWLNNKLIEYGYYQKDLLYASNYAIKCVDKDMEAFSFTTLPFSSLPLYNFPTIGCQVLISLSAAQIVLFTARKVAV